MTPSNQHLRFMAWFEENVDLILPLAGLAAIVASVLLYVVFG